MVNTKLDRKALAEVYCVILSLNNKEFSKIPKNLIEAIKKNMDNEYEVNIHEIEKGNMLADTEKILATIYAYYLSSSEEKKVIWDLIEFKKSKHSKAMDLKKKK